VIASNTCTKANKHSNEANECAGPRGCDLGSQSAALDLEKHDTEREEAHNGDERDRVGLGQRGDITFEHEVHGRAEEEETEDNIMVSLSAAVLVQKELRHATIHGETTHKTSNTNIRGQHTTGKHKEGINRQPCFHNLTTGHTSKRSDDGSFSAGGQDGTDINNSDCSGNENGVEERAKSPHITQCLDEDSRLLLLNEVGGRLEAGDAKERRAIAEDDGLGIIRLDEALVLPIRVELIEAVRADVEDGADNEREESHDVQGEDNECYRCRFTNTDDVKDGEEEEEANDAVSDPTLIKGDRVFEIMNRFCGGDNGGGNIRQNSQNGGDGSSALASSIEQDVISTTVKRQGSHSLTVDSAEHVEHHVDDEDSDGSEHAALRDALARHVQHRADGIVATDGGGAKLA